MLRPLPLHQLRHGGGHIGIAAGAQHPVHLGQLRADLLTVALGQATRHQQLLQLTCLFQLRQLQDAVDGLALGRLDEAAGVQHCHVGPLRFTRDVVPRSPAQGHHLLGVHQIFGAAQGYKGYFVWHDVSLQYFLILYQKFCHLLGGKMSHCLFGPFE